MINHVRRTELDFVAFKTAAGVLCFAPGSAIRARGYKTRAVADAIEFQICAGLDGCEGFDSIAIGEIAISFISQTVAGFGSESLLSVPVAGHA